MPRLVLTRTYMPHGTYGQLQCSDGPTFPTVERAWVSNTPWISCIPEGTYIVKKGTFYRNNNNPDDDYPCLVVEDVPGRTLIKVHRANWPHQLNGCIAPGLKLGSASSDGKEFGVASSTKALDELLEWWGNLEYCELEIRSDKVEVWSA